MKKIFVILVLIFTYVNVAAEELKPIDAVLVLDVSRSMRTADPYRISRDAMNMFVGKLAEDRDRVGIVAYAGNVERSLDLRWIHTGEDRAELQGFISGLEYASWTDHGVGLIEAVRMFGAGEENGERQGIILFFTDGNMNVNPWGVRTNEDAQHDVYTAIAAAYEMGIPIHTIGLNFDGNLAWQPIEYIAEATNGLAFETANAADIPEIISAFFQEMIAAPQTREEEPESQPTPEPTAQPEEIPQEEYAEFLPEEPEIITYETEENTYENNTRSILIAIAAGAIIAIFAGFLLAKKPRRVFTGKVIIEVNGTATKPRTLNLIEYGNRVTLGTLLQGSSPAAFDSVILTPSPTAPSHLPQLQIQCKNRAVTFTKDFMEQDISSGISISSGTEVTLAAEETQVRLKYI
ncbi:MAG: VWA domain-containing protein [Defluviitaleaceae bacterium]|nr:VWA domain-containing protein [Defluviitaleaceae bacterium]MCL2263565.1 VWA domain-containing protein [Defluviitaleaceae bacterium]